MRGTLTPVAGATLALTLLMGSADQTAAKTITIEDGNIPPSQRILQEFETRGIEIELEEGNILRVEGPKAPNQDILRLEQEQHQKQRIIVQEKEEKKISEEAAAEEAREVAQNIKKQNPTDSIVSAQAANGNSSDEPIWNAIAHCESTDNWEINTGNGYFGGLQEDMEFWTTYGGLEYAERPDLATKEQQIIVARRARDGYNGYKTRGYSPWPTCGQEF